MVNTVSAVTFPYVQTLCISELSVCLHRPRHVFFFFFLAKILENVKQWGEITWFAQTWYILRVDKNHSGLGDGLW